MNLTKSSLFADFEKCCFVHTGLTQNSEVEADLVFKDDSTDAMYWDGATRSSVEVTVMVME